MLLQLQIHDSYNNLGYKALLEVIWSKALLKAWQIFMLGPPSELDLVAQGFVQLKISRAGRYTISGQHVPVFDHPHCAKMFPNI